MWLIRVRVERMETGLWLQVIRVGVVRRKTVCLLFRVRVKRGETHRCLGVTPLLVGVGGIGGILGKGRGLVGRKLVLGLVHLLVIRCRLLDGGC